MSHAAALPMSGLTALVALRDVAKVRSGQRVLVLGASGGVGVMAVQIARLFGAHTTAVASGSRLARLEALGADVTVDYRETPLPAMRGSFDAILDFTSQSWFREVAHLLSPTGVFIPADPIRNLRDLLFRRRAKYLMVDRGEAEGLRTLAAWAGEGALEAVVSDVYPLADYREAVERAHARGRLGRIVLEFAGTTGDDQRAFVGR